MKQLLLILLLCLMAVGVAHGQEQFTVYFDFDIDEANAGSDKDLSHWVANHNNAHIQFVYGYTDSIGKINYNNNLSLRRATSVYNQLKNASVVITGAEIKGLGESVAELDIAKNRKVVIAFTTAEEPPVILTQNLEAKQPEPQPVIKTLEEQLSDAKKGDKIILQNITFYYDSPMLLPQSTPMLDKLVYLLKIKGSLKIDIQGHKCCSLSDATNLSGDRAKSVYQYLINHDIDKNRLSYQGFGTDRPIYSIPEKTELQREANRRVEIEVIENK